VSSFFYFVAFCCNDTVSLSVYSSTFIIIIIIIVFGGLRERQEATFFFISLIEKNDVIFSTENVRLHCV
jgi:hypothetical protein